MASPSLSAARSSSRQELLPIDPKLLQRVRLLGFISSLWIAAINALVSAHVIHLASSQLQLGWWLAAAFVVIGSLILFWNPYTFEKVRLFMYLYTVLGALMTTFITGFSTQVYLSWAMFIMFVIAYLGYAAALAAYSVLMFSVSLWLSQPGVTERVSASSEFYSLFSIGFLLVIVAGIWRVAQHSMESLQQTTARQSFEHGQLTSLVNSMADGVIAVDTKATVVLYNAAALNVLDLNSSMQGKSLKKFVTLYDKKDNPVDVVQLVLDTKLANVSRDYRLKYSDGSFANVYLSIAPVHLGYGKGADKKGSQGFVLLLRDITREKSLEEERDEFISVVSHELRTPIAISEGNISNAQLIAAKTGDMAVVKTALEEAHNQILFLADMINDLATLSRAERGKLVLEVEPIDVAKLVHDLTANYSGEAASKDLQLHAKVAENLTPLSSSKLYVREVLQNFITNAIKYTEQGSVTITATQTAQATVFAVQDTGIGISKSDQDRVFDKFFRSEDYRTRQTGGTGLGLYVTMKLTRLIHADIAVDSELNKGSTFRITIPNVSAEPTQTSLDHQ